MKQQLINSMPERISPPLHHTHARALWIRNCRQNC